MHLVEFSIKQAILGKYCIKRATFESFEEKSKLENNFEKKKFPESEEISNEKNKQKKEVSFFN